MSELLLYTTEGCHLCDEAELLLDQLRARRQFQLESVDISSSQELVDSYGLRIPVVRNRNSGVEIGWPFSLDDLASLV